MADSPDSPMLNTATSTFLLQGLQDSANRTAWRTFVERYRPMIENYARRLGLSDADSQDAAQQTLIAFCTAYQAGQYQRDRGRLRSWLFGIARRQILNAMRSLDRHGEGPLADPADGAEPLAADGQDPLEKIWDQEWRDAVIRQCLDEVRREFDERSIQAFERFAWKGDSARQVADQLGMTPNAVFIAKHRIMKRIRELLPQMEENW